MYRWCQKLTFVKQRGEVIRVRSIRREVKIDSSGVLNKREKHEGIVREF